MLAGLPVPEGVQAVDKGVEGPISEHLSPREKSNNRSHLAGIPAAFCS